MNRSPGDESETKEEMEHTVFVPIIKLEAPDTEASDENFFQEQGDLKYNFGLLGSEAEDPLAVQEADRLQGSQIKVEVEKDYVEHQNNQNSLLSQVPSSSNSYIETKRGETMPEFERLDVVGTNVNQVLIKEEKDDEKSRFKEEESIDINSIEDEMMVQAGNSDERLQGAHGMEKCRKDAEQITDIIVISRQDEGHAHTLSKDELPSCSYIEPEIKVSLTCSQCYYSTDNTYQLRKHSLVHLRVKKVNPRQSKNCALCPFTCTTPQEMRKHNFSNHGEKTFPCPHCDYSYWRRSNLNTHMLQHSKEKKFKCTECEYASKTAYRLKMHMYIHFGQSQYQCKVCSKVCISSRELTQHMFTHTGERPYKCTQCRYSSAQLASLKNHMLVHSKEKPYKCSECEFATKTAKILKTHMYRHTGDKPKPFLCEVCSSTFAEKRQLNNHLMIHSTDPKPHKCALCPYSSRETKGLACHMFKHTGESPHKCDKCDYVGGSASLLKTHSKVHTGVKPKKCPKCEYSCRDSGNLRKHVLIHSGERPLKCTICPYACRDPSALKVHIARHLKEPGKK